MAKSCSQDHLLDTSGIVLQGLLLYSIDQTLIFDPSEFGAEVTPAAVHLALSQREPLRALFIALRLREEELIQHALMSVPDYWVSFQSFDSSKTTSGMYRLTPSLLLKSAVIEHWLCLVIKMDWTDP